MRSLITGITGFAGQYLAEHLVAGGDAVIGSTYRDEWNRDVPETVRRGVSVFEWNLAQPLPEDARAMIARFAPDTIFHLAAISVPVECGAGEPSALARAVNVEGTRAVLDLARSLPAPPRVLVISSAHVYAPVSSESPRVAEDAPLDPRGAYGLTKLECEQLCQAAVRDGLDVIVARAFQHAGPRQLPKFMLPEWAEQFARPGSEPIRVVTLNSHNDLSDVRDVVRAYRCLLQVSGTRGIYNVGSGVSVRSGDIFQRLVQLSGQLRGVVERSPGRRQHPIADISRIASDTGWQPRIPLEQTLRDTLAYFQARAE